MNTTNFKKTILATTVTLLLLPVHSIAQAKNVKQYGKGAPFSIKELPPGHVKSKLKSLSRSKQKKAMKWLHSIAFTDHDLKHIKIDNEGSVLFGDSFELPELTEAATDSAEHVQNISPTQTFKLHSNPNASNVIYIDVDGHTFSNTAWSADSIEALPFDTDGSPSTFNDVELAKIAEIWHRVAEDFAPFDTDVTTEEPSSFGPTTGRILITSNKDASGNDMPYSTSGGVAYVNVWGRSNYANYYSPALVYYDNLSSFAPYIAEAAAHEMGHNLGLSHDGTSSASYYTGHGSGFVSWGAIMGVGYYTNVTQWSQGEYLDATQQQDDIQIITDHLSSRTDDHGNDIFNPTSLLVDTMGNINVTSTEIDPLNTSPDNKGIIESRNDIDFFSFDAGAGAVNIIVTPAWDSFYNSTKRGANLDIKAELYDSNGQLIASHNPLDETDAQIAITVESGQYLLAISGMGNSDSPYSDYGSLGQYFISGKVEPFVVENDTTPPSPNPMGWAVAPYSQSRASIAMQATTATDESGTVQYNFICLSDNNCNSSGWQSSNQYTATNLVAGTQYSFQVIAKDAYNNETDASTAASTTTMANTAPVATDLSVVTQENSAITIDLTLLSSDADNDTLTYTVNSAANGSISHNNGTALYTPHNTFSGTDSFSYTINDGFGGVAEAVISITVTAVNHAPTASASAQIDSDSLTAHFSSANSFDPDAGDTLDYHWDFGDGSSSTLANPSYTYANDGDYYVTLTVTDNHKSASVDTLSITLANQNTALPETPSNLSYTVDKIVTGRGKRKTISGTIALNWGASNFSSGYNIWQCTEVTTGKGKGKGKKKRTSCNYSQIDTVQNTALTVPLTNNTVRFKVSAFNDNGTSSFSHEVIVKP